jgi:hypothetical protein
MRALQLSTQQRECLIEHAGGPQPFWGGDDSTHKGLRQTKLCLIDLGLLRSTDSLLNPRPQELKLTEDGSVIVCYLMSRMIEALVTAEHLDPLTGQKALASITASSQKRRQKCTEKHTPYPAVATPMETHAQSTLRDKGATKKLAELLAGS